MTTPSPRTPLPIVVLISGRGSNLQAILERIEAGELPVTVRAVVSNRPEAAGLEYARRAGIPAEVVDHRGYASREHYDDALAEVIERYQPALVVLAGFMRILTPGFVQRFRGRLINIHPSLLPKFKGLDTHRRALEAGEKEHGASVHLVTEALDGGPVLMQARVPVHPDDTPETLAERVLAREHRLYPEVLRLFAEGRLDTDPAGRPRIDGHPLEHPLRLEGE